MITKTKKVENKNKNKRLAFEEGVIAWTSFYKANPHRFALDVLGINLHLFQQIIIYMFWHCDFNMLIAARGIGKSF